MLVVLRTPVGGRRAFAAPDPSGPSPIAPVGRAGYLRHDERIGRDVTDPLQVSAG